MDFGNKKVLNILIAEDDNLMKDMYIEWLSDILKGTHGIIISILSNGREISECLSKKSFDITILDMALPVVSGIDLYRAHSAKMGDVILASTYAKVFYEHLNANEKCIILNKPFDKKTLKNALESLPEVNLNADTRTDCDIAEYVFI